LYANLLKEIRSIERNSRILFTSYEFNQYFFERHVFPRFEGRALPLVLIDYQTYQQTISKFGASRLAESKYFLEPIELPHGIFHPKIVLSCSDEKLKLIVASANLTPQGYTANAELCTSIGIHHSEKAGHPFLRHVDDFLQLLESRVSSKPHRQQVRSLLQKCDFPRSFGGTDESTEFVHNMSRTILEQIHEILDENEVQEALVLSPFFSQNETIYNKFSELFGHTKLLLEVGNNNAPIRLLRNNAKFEFVSITNRQKRSLHAKAIILKTQSSSYCLTGSANFTESALLKTAYEGNCEACLLRREDPDYFDYLFHGDFATSHIEADQVNPIEMPPDTNESKPAFRILEAHLDQRGLVIILDRLPAAPVNVYVESIEKHVEIEEPSNEMVIPLSDEIRASLVQSSLVMVRFRKDGIELCASRLVHNPQYGPLPFLSELINEDEKIWLFHILDRLARLPTPSMLYGYLKRLDDCDFFEKDSATKEEMLLKLKLKFDAIASSPTQQLKELLEKAIARHERRLNKWLANPDSSTAVLTVESFLMLNKLILWGVYRSDQTGLTINTLRNVRLNTENFTVCYAPVISRYSKEILRDLLSHVAVTAFLIDYMQSGSLDFRLTSNGRRNYLKEVFDETAMKAIDKITHLSEGRLSRKKIETTLDEYSEFMSIRATSEDVCDCLLRINRSLAAIGRAHAEIIVDP
jgi:hypothetical protein